VVGEVDTDAIAHAHVGYDPHAGAGLVLDDDRLPEHLAQLRADQAQEQVARATRRRRSHQTDRTIRILAGLRNGLSRREPERDARAGEEDAAPQGTVRPHGGGPRAVRSHLFRAHARDGAACLRTSVARPERQWQVDM
jgi:hypothetical protein